MKKEVDLKLELRCNSTAISEIKDDNVEWGEDGVVQIDSEEVSEITRGDDKPFFVEFVGLYEGMSSNSRNYTSEAVKSCVEAMVGVNMYKGHVEPGTAGWKYREPVGRIVAAKLSKIDIPGKKGVLCAKGKAYITEADPKLRTDIAKKMAGAVSILGRARSIKKLGDTKYDVIKLHPPLDSVDFCNPGTNGMKHAGVTAVVAEMSGEQIETKENIEVVEQDSNNMSGKKLTKDELLAEYKPEITALVGEQVEDQIQEIATGRREIAEKNEAFKDEKSALDSKISEMEVKLAEMAAENKDLLDKLNVVNTARMSAELEVFADAHVSEMKGVEGANVTLIDLASEKVAKNIIEGDLDKSKKLFTDSFIGALDELVKISEMIGVKKADVVVKTHNSNPTNSQSKGANKFMSPELLKSHNERVGAN